MSTEISSANTVLLFVLGWAGCWWSETILGFQTSAVELRMCPLAALPPRLVQDLQAYCGVEASVWSLSICIPRNYYLLLNSLEVKLNQSLYFYFFISSSCFYFSILFNNPVSQETIQYVLMFPRDCSSIGWELIASWEFPDVCTLAQRAVH